VASSGISVRLWRLYTQAWLICLLFPIVFLIQMPLVPVRLFLAVAGLVIFVITYTWFMWPHPLSSGPRDAARFRLSLILLIGLTLLVLGLSLAYGNAFLWLFVGVSGVVGVVFPGLRSAFVAVVVLTLLTLGLGIGLSGGLATGWL